MTQVIDPKNPSSSHPAQSDPLPAFHSTSETPADGRDSRNDSSSGNSSNPNSQPWPALAILREIITAFALDMVARSQPLRDRLSVVASRLWSQYLGLVQAYPLLTAFLSCLILFSAGPVAVFVCVTGISLGILVGIATAIVFLIQSVVVCIAGGILLLVLGIILLLTAFSFFWLAIGFIASKFIRSALILAREQHQAYQAQQEAKAQEGQTTANAQEGKQDG